MLLQQPLAGQEPEPEEERHRRVLEVLRQPPGGVEVGLLDHVGGVDPALEAAVEPQGDHPPQPVAVPRQQLRPGPLVAPRGLLDQAVDVAVPRWRGHTTHHIPLTGTAPGSGTADVKDTGL